MREKFQGENIMAITSIEYSVFRFLREQNVLPLGGDILELGEANWYGDVNPDLLKQDVLKFAPEDSRGALSLRLNEILQAKRPTVTWELADVFWSVLFQPRSMTAIDFGGTERALKLDLNTRIDLQRQFNVVLNLGTAEHVFNVAQVFKTIHEHTLQGGIMVHGLPFSGWIDHGFFNFNPTFYWDIASANNYTLMLAVYAELAPLKLIQLDKRETILEMTKNEQIGQNSLIYVVFRKPDQIAEFRIPLQGYYASTISREAVEAWQTLR